LKGKFIVIEGTDGSGKGTQTRLLEEWFDSKHIPIAMFDFPQYGQPSAYFVEKYLNGEFGPLADIDAYKGSLFYALDRFDASLKIRELLEAGTHILSNRYVASNMGHQGAKLDDSAERARYFAWNDNLEYEVLGIPRPDLNIVLHMPSLQAQLFVDQKAMRTHLQGKTRDLHEADLSHLEKAERTYLELCAKFPDNFRLIECQAQDGSILSIEDIQEQIKVLVKNVIS
jgi:dTMP kinase